MKLALQIVVTLLLLFGAYWALMSLFGMLVSLLIIGTFFGAIWLVISSVWKGRQRENLARSAPKRKARRDREAEHALQKLEKQIKAEETSLKN